MSAYYRSDHCRQAGVSASIARHMSLPVRSRAVVMADVAKLAGVSQQTVSRVLNDSPHVRADTRERVLDAMRKLEYRPNPARARARHRPLAHARRRELRHDALRPGVDAARDRARRARRRLLRLIASLALARRRRRSAARSSGCASRASTASS